MSKPIILERPAVWVKELGDKKFGVCVGGPNPTLFPATQCFYEACRQVKFVENFLDKLYEFKETIDRYEVSV